MAFDWKPSKGVWIFLIFLGLVMMGNAIQDATKQEATKNEAARRAALTSEQRAAEDAAKANEKRLVHAQVACYSALEKTLYDPDSAKLESMDSWYVEKRKDGTILVQPAGRAKNAFGAYIIGTWNCVTKQIGGNTVVLSLKQIRP